MAQDGNDLATPLPDVVEEQAEGLLSPPVITPPILSPPVFTPPNEEGDTEGSQPSQAMERTFSQDIKEGSQELKDAAEQTRNIILDLGLDGVIRWVSPSWTDVVGTNLEAVKGNPISRFIADDAEVFNRAIESLKSDDSKSKFVRFSVKVGQSSDLDPMLLGDQKIDLEKPNEGNEPPQQLLALEGQGIMVYDRASGGESHVSPSNYARYCQADPAFRQCGWCNRP
jgi:PAS domain-containing protein